MFCLGDTDPVSVDSFPDSSFIVLSVTIAGFLLHSLSFSSFVMVDDFSDVSFVAIFVSFGLVGFLPVLFFVE